MEYVIIAAVIIFIILAIRKAKNGSAASNAATNAPERKNRPLNGDSWGVDMPSEPNQFNYPGNWQDYFTEVLKQEFPGYNITSGYLYECDSMVFLLGGEDSSDLKLMILVLSEKVSESKVLRTMKNAGVDAYALIRSGVPRIRFYHNHKGWWNTRSYIVRRTNEALNGTH